MHQRRIIIRKNVMFQLSLFTLLSSRSYMLSLCNRRSGRKITLTFAWIPIPSLLLWLLVCQLNSVQGGCHFGRVSLFPYIVIKGWFSPWPRSPETRCAHSLDRPLTVWAQFKGDWKKNEFAEMYERELAGNQCYVTARYDYGNLY